jgi:hypothetical protein
MIVNKTTNNLNLSLDNQDYIKGVTGNDVIITNIKKKDNYYQNNIRLNFKIIYISILVVYNNINKMTKKENDCYLINLYKRNKDYCITKINNINSYYNDNI